MGTTNATRTTASYADEIMGHIDDGIAESVWPATLSSWSELDGLTDANDLMLGADVPFDVDDSAVMDFYCGVQDEVTRRLAARAGFTAGRHVDCWLDFGGMRWEPAHVTRDYDPAEDRIVHVRTVSGLDLALGVHDVRIIDLGDDSDDEGES